MPSAACDSELVLLRAPFDVRRRPIDPQEHERRLPHELACLRIDLLLPDIRISVLRGSDDAVGVRRPVDRGDELVVLYTMRSASDMRLIDECTNLRQRHGVHPLRTLASVDLRVVAVQADDEFCSGKSDSVRCHRARKEGLWANGIGRR